MIVDQPPKKSTRNRRRQIARQKQPIEADAYYTIAEITDPKSPYRLCSESTIFRALRLGHLQANYVGRKTLLKGSNIHKWIEAEAERRAA